MIGVLSTPDGTTVEIVQSAAGDPVVLTHRRPLTLLPERTWPKRMRVVIPFTEKHPQTIAGAPPETEWWDVSRSTDAYWGALLSWWADGRDFLVVEHDVTCRPDILDELDACPEPWCAYPYDSICHPECMDGWRNALGCTRFRADLMRDVPNAVSAIPADARDWHGVCDGLGNNLRAAGYTHHWHTPAIEHHRQVQSPTRDLASG